MASGSPIEWTESTWNPVTGCNKISPGCKNCYAERLSKRLKAMGQSNYKNGFKLTTQPQMLDLPLGWKKPQTIFVNSMSDLFHKDIPLDYIQQVFDEVKFLSLEPLLGSLKNLDLTEIDWVIVGGESGYGARPIKEEWVLDIRGQCQSFNVPFFFKQWGGVNKKKTGRLLEGKTWDEMPFIHKIAA
ncbi:MAG: phage Gp37/Gp68 family protein [Acidobacteria bacterium]|nr:phage Gp37/Gp68 family protein [Acidobacteriota bacterium]